MRVEYIVNIYYELTLMLDVESWSLEFGVWTVIRINKHKAKDKYKD